VLFSVCEGVRYAFSVYVCVFLTIVISKIFEKLIKARIEDKLKEINLLQAGSRTNCGLPDNVFLFRGVMDHFKFTKGHYFSLPKTSNRHLIACGSRIV
jgi:hypothetical protein